MVQSDSSFTSIHERKEPPPLFVSSSFSTATADETETKRKRQSWQWCFLLLITIWCTVVAIAWITLAFLLFLSSKYADFGWGITRSQVPDVVAHVQTMSQQIRDPVAQTKSCIQVWALEENAPSGELMPSHLSTMLSALEAHPFHPPLQQHCLRAIGSSFSSLASQGVDSSRVLAAVLSAMDGNKDIAEVQVHSIHILAQLPKPILLQQNQQVVSLIVESFAKHPTNEGVVQESLRLLTRLATENDNHKMDVDVTVPEQASRMLQFFLNIGAEEPTCNHITSRGRPEHVRALLKLMSTHKAFYSTDGAAQLKTIPSLWETLAQFDDLEIVDEAIDLLRALETGEYGNPRFGLSSKESELLLTKMKQHSANTRIQLNAMRLLEASHSVTNSEELASVLIQAMKEHDRSKEIARSCLNVLANHSRVLDRFHQFANSELVDVLVNSLWRFQDVEDIQISVVEILSRYVELSYSFPVDRDREVTKAVDSLASLPVPLQKDGPAAKTRARFYLRTMLYNMGNESIQQVCLSHLAKLGPISEGNAFDIVRGTYRTYGSRNSSIRRNSLAILEQLGRKHYS